MKRLFILFALLCPAAYAQTTPVTAPSVAVTAPSVTVTPPTTTATPTTTTPAVVPNPSVTPANNGAPPRSTTINGQKFFSLQNVRRHNGQGLSPSALSVLHHPRPAAGGTRNRARPTPRNNNETEPPKKNNDILSVFPSSTPTPSPLPPPTPR